MYHNTTVINGILHYKSNPKDEYKPYTAEQLTKMYVELSERFVKHITNIVDCSNDDLNQRAQEESI